MRGRITWAFDWGGHYPAPYVWVGPFLITWWHRQRSDLTGWVEFVKSFGIAFNPD